LQTIYSRTRKLGVFLIVPTCSTTTEKTYVCGKNKFQDFNGYVEYIPKPKTEYTGKLLVNTVACLKPE
jgi:hypothetical protein